MGTKSISLFATRADCEPFLQIIETTTALNYMRCGLFVKEELILYNTYLSIDDFGTTFQGAAVGENRYLIAPSDTQIQVRAVPQRKGGVLYAIDQWDNPTSIILQPGGRYRDKYVISGQLGTISDDPVSVNLYRSFLREIRKRFTYIGSYWVGPEALQLCKEGVCLTHDISASKDYCLPCTKQMKQ